MSIMEKIMRIPFGFHIIDMTNNEEYEVREDKPLDLNSSDPTERELADSTEKLKVKYDKPTGKAGKGKSKFKVEEAELSEEKEIRVQKEASKEEDLER